MRGRGKCDICGAVFEGELDELLIHRNRSAVSCGKKRHFSSVERYHVEVPHDTAVQTICLQGPLEYCFARWCLKNGVRWTRPAPLLYHSRNDVVEERTRNYYPDFFLPAADVYVETKGKYPKKDVDKMKDVFASNPDVRICLIRACDFDVLNLLGDDAAFTSPGFSNDEDLPVAKLKAEALHGIFGMDASGGLRQHTA
jgi:hypothetical protein